MRLGNWTRGISDIVHVHMEKKRRENKEKAQGKEAEPNGTKALEIRHVLQQTNTTITH